ncbi:MAG: Holliday junction resolvase RuvX [Candidatus Dadabacteria bacterium]|nr:Holliday junction resolvase RuvX [Candidatus Dadabacteria bacterium]NIQ14028.1 Holliday junction resolvase RuvX [Candidatus Dadabacteria bacterium]
MKTLALDIGTKTIGVAISDELGITANGVETIKRKNIKSDLDKLKIIADKYNPDQILIGLPYDPDGSLGERGQNIERFSKKIKSFLKLPIQFWDESYSTAKAEKFLIKADVSRKKRKKVIDKMAAVVILQEYLESIN